MGRAQSVLILTGSRLRGGGKDYFQTSTSYRLVIVWICVGDRTYSTFCWPEFGDEYIVVWGPDPGPQTKYIGWQNRASFQ